LFSGRSKGAGGKFFHPVGEKHRFKSLQIIDRQGKEIVNGRTDSVSKPLMILLYTKKLKIIKHPLINGRSRLSFNYMPIRKSFGMGLLAFFLCVVGVQGAADFKIRYNQKFPCLEVMDSSAVKITDVTEGAKGETVTSGKSSLNISFIKNSSGQPEVTLRDAKSPLSEMEIEAFGLSVGMKPEGTVLVRFGADNKPKFEMDRTGGSRFLMADLGNLDTAAGKEVAANTAPSKNLIRCRERFADWIGGKGGWSNKSGKILETEGGDLVKVGELPDREIKVSEAFQSGAVITVGNKKPLLFQSGAGVFHLALPGTVFSLGKLEAGSADLKIELTEGTIQTFVAEPLKAPRGSLIALGNGEVARTLDASYQIARTAGPESTTTLTSISGKVILAQEAGGKEVATLSGEKTWSGSKGGEPRALSANTPEKSSLVALQELARNTALIDIARDGVKACPEAVEEIVSTAVKASPELAQTIAEQCLLANPKSLKVIAQASGVKGLKLSKEEQAKVDALESLDQRLERLAIDGIDLEMKQGQVLLVEGDCKLDGKKEKIMVGQVLALNDKITTGKESRILVGMAPGVVLSVESGSVATLEKMSSEIKNGELQSREAVVNSESGLVVMNIAPWNKEKTDVRVKTKEGESVAQGTVFAVSYVGGKMMTTVTRGSVGSRDSSGNMVSIAAGQQATPGATPVATPADSPAVVAAGKAVESTVHAMVANVAASVVAAIPTAAAEVAAIAAKAVPAAAEQIAAAVAAKAPEAAIAIAQAVSKVAPQAASKIAAAVIAATPGMDAKSISAITTASSQGAADAPSVDTASGTEAGNAGGVGAGSGNIAAAAQVQQLQAQQDADALKTAQDALAKAKADLAAAKTEQDKAKARQDLANAQANLDKAAQKVQDSKIASAQAEAKAKAAEALQKTSAELKSKIDTANNKDAAYDYAAKANEQAQDSLNDARNEANQAAADSAAAGAAADAQQAVAEASKAVSAAIAGASTKEQAVSLANAAAAAAGTKAGSTKAAQETLAAELVEKQKAEAIAAASAQAAQAAALAASKLQADLAAATTKQAQEAAAAAASQAAVKAASDALNATRAATAAAALAQSASTTTFNSLTQANQSLANEYKLSSPAPSDTTPNSIRSVRAVFSEAQLNANPTLKEFVTKWDTYIEKQQAKFAAAAEQTEKEAASRRAIEMEAAVKAAADLNAAKTAANALIQAAKDAAAAKETARAAAEAETKTKALAEAKAQAEREVAAAAKAAADKLAAEIAAKDLAAAKAAAAQAAAAQEAARKAAEVAELAKAVEAASKEAARLAAIETAAAAAKLAEDIAKAADLAAAKAQSDAIANAARIAAEAEAAKKATADAEKARLLAAEEAAKKAAEEASAKVPVTEGGTKPVEATKAGSNLI
jgi:hypothetical protein